MNSWYSPLLLFPLGILASFTGSFLSGGTSLIALSGMLLLGVPTQLSMATYTMGALGWRLGGFWEFYKAKKIVWTHVLPLSALAFIGSNIGARILIYVDESYAKTFIGFALLLFIPLSLLKKDLGVVEVKIGIKRKLLGYLGYLIVSIWAGFFAAGTGIAFLYVYMLLLGLPIIEIKGTDKIPGLFLDLGAITVFVSEGIFNPIYFLAFFPGMFLGATIGSKYVIKIGNSVLRLAVLASVLFVSLRLILKF